MPSDGAFSIARAMARTGASPALAPHATGARPPLDIARLEATVLALDPGSRALLDLSLRRRLPDEEMAPMLRVDPFHIAWLRARAIERVASELGLGDPIGVGEVRAALPGLGDRAWGLPVPPTRLVRRPDRPPAAPAVVRYLAPPRPPFVDKLRSAAMAARSVTEAPASPARAAIRGGLLTCAGAMLGMALTRRRR